MEKVNYDKKMMDIINSFGEQRPSLLLHTCCAPCSTAVIERLSNYFDITVFYYNPNIEPYEEYLKRKEEQKRLLKEYKSVRPIKFLDCDYENEKFSKFANNLAENHEGGKRCMLCFHLRLKKTAHTASVNNFDYFGTSLTVSPYKNAYAINNIGLALEKKQGVKYLVSDFKKQNGYKRSIILSKEYNLYRQDYCGCKYSKIEREEYKRNKI